MENTIKSTLGICVGKEFDQLSPAERQEIADVFENVRYFLDLGDIYQRIDGTQGTPVNFNPVPVTDPIEMVGKGDWKPWTSVSNHKNRIEKDYPSFGGVTMFGVEALYVDGEFKKFPNKQWSGQERGMTDEDIYNNAYKEMELFESTFPSVTHLQLNEYWADRDVYEIVQKAYTDAAKRIKVLPTSVQASDRNIGGKTSYNNFLRVSDLEYDTLSIHPYSFTELFQAGGPQDLISPPEGAYMQQIVDLKEALEDMGEDKDLWQTEIGWNSTGSMTEDRQAAYLVKGLFIGMANGYTKYFIYQILDKPGELGSLFETTGLLDSDGRKKVSYITLKTLIEAYGHLSFKEKVQEDEELFYYIFTDGEKDFSVSWNPDDLDVLPAIEELVVTGVEDLEPEPPVVLPEEGENTIKKRIGVIVTFVVLIAVLALIIKSLIL